MSEYDVLQQKLIELQEELVNLRRSEYIARAGKAQAVDTQFPDALLHLPFDGGVPHEQDFSVNLFGHKLQRPTVYSGGIIGRPGQFGKAVQCAESTTNLVTNPSFEVDTAGWAATGSGFARSGDATLFGAYSLSQTSTYSGARFNITVAASTKYRLSVYAKSTVAGDGACISWKRQSDSSTVVSRNITLTTEWTRYDLELPDSGVLTTAVYVELQTTTPVSGVVYWDGVQIEQKAYPTPYCDGSLGPGHAWTGTPHASSSTRAATRLAYDPVGNIGADQGTISLWYYMEAETAITQWLLAHYNAAQRIYIYWNPSTNQYHAQLGASIDVNSAYGGDPSRRWVHLVLAWKDGAFQFYEDGVLLGTGVSTVTTISPGPLDIGNNAGAANQQLNGYLDDLLILDRALTAPEVRALYEAGQAGLGVLCPPQSWQPLVGAGAPTWGYPGMTYIDTTNNRWYVNVGGTWRYVGLT